MALSGHLMQCGIMPAFGSKADMKWVREKSPLMTQSGHQPDLGRSAAGNYRRGNNERQCKIDADQDFKHVKALCELKPCLTGQNRNATLIAPALGPPHQSDLISTSIRVLVPQYIACDVNIGSALLA